MTLSKIIDSKPVAAVLSGVKKMQAKRNENSAKYRMTNILLSFFFPLFIVCMAELNQQKYPNKFIIFCYERPTVMLFNIVIAGLIFSGLYMLFKSGWFSMLVQSAGYMVLSISELFKYNTNGNHLTMSDLSLAKSLESLMSFAYIKITYLLMIYVAIILFYIGFAFWFNPKLHVKLKKSFIPAILCIGLCAAVTFVPAVGNRVYAIFDIDTKASKNTFLLNEKFQRNGFLAFFMQDETESVENRLKAPEDYSAATVDSYINRDSNKAPKEAAISKASKKKPNVIVVMSESWADFRIFDDQLHIDKSIYKDFDTLCNDKNAVSGHTIVPTYASYTVRTEFELMFGLPVKSLKDPCMPQRLLPERKQATIATYYKADGYNTYYVHPYIGSFYGRSYIYSNYSFDKMIFEDELNVEPKFYGDNQYIDDETVLDEDLYLIKHSDKPVYIHNTTMQNHQPYGGDTADEQFETYLKGVSHSASSLLKFTEELKKIDEPTIVFFVGDHFPSLRGEGSIYSQLGITSENCSEIYEQHYVLWSNYGADFGGIENNEESVFYIPYVLMNTAGVKGDGFTETMTNKMSKLPIYSTNYKPNSLSDDELDVLTYDRILGDQSSPNRLKDLYTDEELSSEN